MKIYKLVILNFMVISFLVSCKQEKKDTKTQNQISKKIEIEKRWSQEKACLLYTSPSPRDVEESRMPSSA